ncbi:MAG: hypothetical protein ACK4MQ_01245 [Hyphomonas sp.]
MTRLSAYIALIFGPYLAISEIVRNWGDWPGWPFWLAHFIAAGTLTYGALRSLVQGSSRLLSGAWGFTTGIFWVSYFTHAEAVARGAAGEERLTLTIGVMLLIALTGLLMSLTRRSL